MGKWQLRWLVACVGCVNLGACNGAPGAGDPDAGVSAASVGGGSSTSNMGPTSTTSPIGVGGGCGVGEPALDGMGGGSFTLGELAVPERRPPPISGGGLLVSGDGKLAVAADPDRDRLYLVDIEISEANAALTLRAEVELAPGAEPGRLVEASDGSIHVALRGSGELLSIASETGKVLQRRAVCDHPRGVAYDATTDLVHIACAEGRLVSVSPTGAGQPRVWELGGDLRDVLVWGDGLLVSRFRSAELLKVGPEGTILSRVSPPGFQAPNLAALHCGQEPEPEPLDFESGVAWRLLATGEQSALLLHQRAQSSPLELETTQSAYGANGCATTVHSVVSSVGPSGVGNILPALANTTLAVDVAVSPGGGHLAVAAPGNNVAPPLLVFDREEYAQGALQEPEAPLDFCMSEHYAAHPGEVTAVAFATDTHVLGYSRQPANLHLFSLDPFRSISVSLPLSDVDVRDTGHQLFHADVGRGIACASCHPEAGDDGQVWSFAGVGPRRTQSLRGGLLGTEPFHWEGDMTDFSHLVTEVMVRRMGGPTLTADYQDALASWLHAQPAPKRSGLDEQALARGRELFESPEVACASCHTGPLLSNHATVNVGTGLATQVPSLLGVSFRAPYMHDGCAASLLDRFGESCGGGDQHGKTSHLSQAQLTDLAEYLKSL